MHKALGRGLESLIPAMAPKGDAKGSVSVVPVEKIRPNKYQPRTKFNDATLKELATSIKRHGLAQPLLVAPSVVPGEYELIAGERRWRASKIAGLKEVPVVVRAASDADKFHLALIENIQREDLNPIDEAKAYKRLHDEFRHTQEELAQVLGKDRSVIANALRLLNLPGEVQDAIADGALSAGHGRMLAGLPDAAAQKEMAQRIVDEKLTVRDVEKMSAALKAARPGKKRAAVTQDAELKRLAEDLQRRFGTRVKIVGKPAKGRLEIHYFSLADLERLTTVLLAAESPRKE